MIKEVKIPEISENVTSGKVVDVLVRPGDAIEVDDPIIEFETEKAVVEIPSPFRGRVAEILVEEGDELKVGDVIAKIDTGEGEEKQEAPEEKERYEERKVGAGKEVKRPSEKEGRSEEEGDREEPGRKAKERPEEREVEADSQEVTAEGKEGAAEEEEKEKKEEKEAQRGPVPEIGEEKSRGRGGAKDSGSAPASPSVRRFARELGVDIREVRPAEAGGRISEADVKAHVRRASIGKEGEGEPGLPSAEAPARQPELPDFNRWGEIETRELTGVRRLTAEKMVASWQTVVHVTQFERVDITAAAEFIRCKADRAADQGVKLTITPFLMKVCAAALRKFSQFNSSIDMVKNDLILKKYVHIGLAVDTPRGLLVPVVRNADRKTILELAVEIVDLAGRARDKKIKPDEMEGGTFTISNQGGIGGTNFTPVVFWPQAAILGVSQASIEPVYIDGELRPRQILPLALSYDHRIADGADAARFLRWMRESIEHPLAMHFE
jgi:pyruvate dehydrogenase E2 component (dihydrolipoamide acetyltransferase)